MLTGEVHKTLTPHVSQWIEADKETRIELPFALLFESLAYIGVVMNETWRVRPHYHEHFELCYVNEGKGWFAINDFSYEVRKGDLFLTRPGEIHQGAASEDTSFHLYYLGFQLNGMNGLEMDYYQLNTQRVVSDKAGIIREIFEAIFMELRGEQRHTFEMVQGLFLRLLVHILRTYEHIPSDTNMPVALSPMLKQALYLMHTQLGKYRDINDLAQSIHISRSHFTREFKRTLGVSPGHYTRMLCLNQAKNYLRETSASIATIAQHLHFSSIHTFSIFFKRHTSLTPQEYRKQSALQIV